MFLSVANGFSMAKQDSTAGPSYSGGYGGFEGSEFEDNLILSSVRNRKKATDIPCCPVCSCTLRAGELQSHLSLEMDKLTKISTGKRKSTGTPNSSSSSSNGLNEDVDISGSTGVEVYERVRRNRSRRLRLARGRGAGAVACPVCGERVEPGRAEAHVDACLRTQDQDVDVEDVGFGASYSWCSQERVRASALQLSEGGTLPEGALRIRRASTDTELVVDGDEDTLLYGPPQYSPERIAQQESTIEDSTIEVSTDPVLMGDIEEEEDIATQKSNHDSLTSESSHAIVVSVLKDRIRELEEQLAGRAETKCLICMGPYSEPVVSVQCWHVHCETCWLESLRAKKTCPQCNAITGAAHLRRVYI